MAQYQENVTVTGVEQFSSDHWRLTLVAPRIAATARPGQFVMVRPGAGRDPLLGRPFSLHRTAADGTIQIYFKVVGRGTELIAGVRPGSHLAVFGPLGRGFRLQEQAGAILVGGGLGIAPLLFLAEEIRRKKAAYSADSLLLGARRHDELAPLLGDFAACGLQLHTATDDGSLGHHGLITDLLGELQIPGGSVVYTCGPEPMMAAVASFCRRSGLSCQASVESVMACGMGACLGCSRLNRQGEYTHVCLNGPVYDAEELIWKI
jgi:dihydroorotate dehydrogenase electron transfer subunit